MQKLLRRILLFTAFFLQLSDSFSSDSFRNQNVAQGLDLAEAWKVVSDLPDGKLWVRRNPHILDKIANQPTDVQLKIKEFYRNFSPNGPYPTVRNGIQFNEYGFPDFTPYISDKSHVVEILMDGTNQDYLLAYDKLKLILGEGNIQFTNNYGSSFRIKQNGEWSEVYTWHHHEDGKTMMPVLQSIHNNTSHTGGRSVVNSERNISGIFDSPNL